LILQRSTDRSPDDLDELLATGKEKTIKLDWQIPVYILYFTAWVEDHGGIRFHSDVYGRDKRLRPQVGPRLAPANPSALEKAEARAGEEAVGVATQAAADPGGAREALIGDRRAGGRRAVAAQRRPGPGGFLEVFGKAVLSDAQA
jgi:hypothetical protein